MTVSKLKVLVLPALHYVWNGLPASLRSHENGFFYIQAIVNHYTPSIYVLLACTYTLPNKASRTCPVYDDGSSAQERSWWRIWYTWSSQQRSRFLRYTWVFEVTINVRYIEARILYHTLTDDVHVSNDASTIFNFIAIICRQSLNWMSTAADIYSLVIQEVLNFRRVKDAFSLHFRQ